MWIILRHRNIIILVHVHLFTYSPIYPFTHSPINLVCVVDTKLTAEPPVADLT